MDDGFGLSGSESASLPDSAISVRNPEGIAGHEESSRRGFKNKWKPSDGEVKLKVGNDAKVKGPKAVDYMSMEWTDEKHNLYLNSMEASFISQLYSSGYCSKDLFGWLPMLAQKHTRPSGSNCNSLPSGQFKVLRKGCWETLNYERTRTRADTKNEIRFLSASPWIQHFRSPIISRELHLMLTDRMDDNELASRATHFESQRPEGESTTVEQFQACCSRIYHQDSVGSNTEVSDQNFVDRDSRGGEELSGSCRRKRVRN